MEPDGVGTGAQHGYPGRPPGPPQFAPHRPAMSMFNPYQGPSPHMMQPLPPQPYPPLPPPNTNFYSAPPGVVLPHARPLPMYQGPMMYSRMPPLPPFVPHGAPPQLGPPIFCPNTAPIHAQQGQTTPQSYPSAGSPPSPSVFGGRNSDPSPGRYPGPPQQSMPNDHWYNTYGPTQTEETVSQMPSEFLMKVKQHAIKIETPPAFDNFNPASHTSSPSLHESPSKSTEGLMLDNSINKVPSTCAISQTCVNAANISQTDDMAGHFSSAVNTKQALSVETGIEQLRLLLDATGKNKDKAPKGFDQFVTVPAADLDSVSRIAFENVKDDCMDENDDDIVIEDHEFLTYDVESSPFDICERQSNTDALEEPNDMEDFDGMDKYVVTHRLDGDFDEPDGGVCETSAELEREKKQSVSSVSNFNVNSLSDCRKLVQEIEKERADFLVKPKTVDLNNSGEKLTKFASVLVAEAIAKGMLQYLSTNQCDEDLLEFDKGTGEVDINSNVASKTARRRSDGELRKRLYSWTYSMFDTNDAENLEIEQSGAREEKGDYENNVDAEVQCKTIGYTDSKSRVIFYKRSNSAPPTNGNEVDEAEVENLKASIEDFEKFYFKQRAKVNNITIESPPKGTTGKKVGGTTGEKVGSDHKKVIKDEEWIFPDETAVNDTMSRKDSFGKMQPNRNSQDSETFGRRKISESHRIPTIVSNRLNDSVKESHHDSCTDHFEERAKMNNIVIENPTAGVVGSEMTSHKSKDLELGGVWAQNEQYGEKLNDIVSQLGNVVEESLQFNINSDQSSTSGRSASVWSYDDEGEQDLSGHSFLDMSGRSLESEENVEIFKQKAMAKNIIVQDPKEIVEYTLGKPGSGRIVHTGNVGISLRTSSESEGLSTNLNPTCPEFKSCMRRSSSEGRTTGLNPVSPEFKPGGGFKKMIGSPSSTNGLDSKKKLRVDAPVFSPGSLNTRPDTCDEQDSSMRSDALEFYPAGSDNAIMTGSSLLNRPTATKSQTKLSLETTSDSSAPGAKRSKPVICFLREPPVKKSNPSVGLQVSPETCDSCVGTRRRKMVESSTLTANCDSRDVMINTDESISKEESMYHVVEKPTKKMVSKSMNTDDVRKRSVGVMVRDRRTVVLKDGAAVDEMTSDVRLELENKVRYLSERVRTLQLEVMKYKQREIQEKLKTGLDEDVRQVTEILWGDGNIGGLNQVVQTKMLQAQADLQQIQVLTQRTVAEINGGRIFNKLPEFATGVCVTNDNVSCYPMAQTSSMIHTPLDTDTVVSMTATDSNLVNSYSTVVNGTESAGCDRITDIPDASAIDKPTAVQADEIMAMISSQYVENGTDSVPQFQSAVDFPTIDMTSLRTQVNSSTAGEDQLVPPDSDSVSRAKSPSKMTSSKHSPRVKSLSSVSPSSLSVGSVKSRISPQRTVEEGENVAPEEISVAESVRELEYLKCEQSATSPNAKSLLDDIEDIDDVENDLIGARGNAGVVGVDLEEFKSVGEDMRKLISDKMFAEYSQPDVEEEVSNDAEDEEEPEQDLSELDWDDESRTDLYTDTDRQETPIETIDSDENDKMVSKTDTMVVTDADGNVEVVEKYVGVIETEEIQPGLASEGVQSELPTEGVQSELVDSLVENVEPEMELKDTDEKTNEVSQTTTDKEANEIPVGIEDYMDRLDSISSEEMEIKNTMDRIDSISPTRTDNEANGIVDYMDQLDSISSEEIEIKDTVDRTDCISSENGETFAVSPDNLISDGLSTSCDSSTKESSQQATGIETPPSRDSIASNDLSAELPKESAAALSSFSGAPSFALTVSPSPMSVISASMITSPLSSSPLVPMSSVMSPLSSTVVSPVAASLNSSTIMSPLFSSVVTSPAAMPMDPSMLTSHVSAPSLGKSDSLSLMMSGLDPSLYQAVFAQLIQSYPQLVGNQEMLTGIAMQQTQLLQFYMSTGQTPDMSGDVSAGVASISTSVPNGGVRSGNSVMGTGNMVGMSSKGMKGNMCSVMSSDATRKLDSTGNVVGSEVGKSNIFGSTSDRAKLRQVQANASMNLVPTSLADIGTSEVRLEFKKSPNSLEKGKHVGSKPAPTAGRPPGLEEPFQSNYFASNIQKPVPQSLFRDNVALKDPVGKQQSTSKSVSSNPPDFLPAFARKHSPEFVGSSDPKSFTKKDEPAVKSLGGKDNVSPFGKNRISPTDQRSGSYGLDKLDSFTYKQDFPSLGGQQAGFVQPKKSPLLPSPPSHERVHAEHEINMTPKAPPRQQERTDHFQLSHPFGTNHQGPNQNGRTNLPPRLRRVNSKENRPPPSYQGAPPNQQPIYPVHRAESEDWDSEVDPYPQQFQLQPNNNWHINLGGNKTNTTVGGIGEMEKDFSGGKRGISMAGDTRSATASVNRKTVNMTGDAKRDPAEMDFKKPGNDGGTGMMDISEISLPKNAPKLSDKEEDNDEEVEDEWCTVQKTKKKRTLVRESNQKELKSYSAPLVNSAQVGKRKPPVMSSFERLVARLQQEFPHVDRENLVTAVMKIRDIRGSLSGLSVDDIIQKAQAYISTSKNKGVWNPVGATRQPSLPRAPPAAYVQSDATDEEICVICHDHLHSEPTKMLDCSHIYHTRCISEWVRRERTCPTCRTHALFPEEFPRLGK